VDSNTNDIDATISEERHKNKPTLEQGNYIIEVVSNNQLIRKLVVVNSEINIVRFNDGGLAMDIIQ
jgi:DNA polymerase sigma